MSALLDTNTSASDKENTVLETLPVFARDKDMWSENKAIQTAEEQYY